MVNLAFLSQYPSSWVSFISFLHLSITFSWGMLLSCQNPEHLLMLKEILNSFKITMFLSSSTACWALSTLLPACNLHIGATLTLKCKSVVYIQSIYSMQVVYTKSLQWHIYSLRGCFLIYIFSFILKNFKEINDSLKTGQFWQRETVGKTASSRKGGFLTDPFCSLKQKGKIYFILQSYH